MGVLAGSNDEKVIDGSSAKWHGGMCHGRIVSQQSTGVDGESDAKILPGAG
jgi:hypothetical protein